MKVNIQSEIPQFDYQFTVKESGIVGVYGISGSGKSSLLRAIAGFQNDLKGSIEFKKTSLLNTKRKQFSKTQKTSYMSQSPILFPHWTIKQNLDFAETHSIKNNPQTNHLISELKCDDLLSHYPHQLSGGEQQRVAFIRALISSRTSDIMLLDEPFSALDKIIKNTALEILKNYKNDNLIYLVTHDINELYQYSDELLLIENGTNQYQNDTLNAMASGQFQLPIASKLIINNTPHIIYADDVSLSLNTLTDSSIVHQYPVTINNITNDKSTALLKLKCQDNQILFAKITLQSLNRLQLALNQKVMANFKATSFK